MTWFHELKDSQCKFITGKGMKALTDGGVKHRLSIACGAPTGGATYCPHHTTLTAPEWSPQPMHAPRDVTRAAAPPREDRQPELTEVIR